MSDPTTKDVQWMFRKLISSQVRIRVHVYQNCSIEAGARDVTVVGRLQGARVRRHEERDGPYFEIDLKFMDGTHLQAPPMSQFSSGFYGMTNGHWAPDDAFLRIDPAPRLWERLRGAYRRIFDQVEDT